MNANFAHFENFHKSSSADFGAFNASQSSTTAAAASKAAVSKPGLPSADKYAALANLDNIFSAGQGMALCSLVCSRCVCVCSPQGRLRWCHEVSPQFRAAFRKVTGRT